jgi:hypothetical protein
MTPTAWTGSGTAPTGPSPAPRPPAPRSSARSSTYRQHYHFGPGQDRHVPPALPRGADQPSGVWRILKRLGLNRLPASQRHQRHDRRWKRYEKPLPGHRVQLEVKFIGPLTAAPTPTKHDQFTAIDDCTRLRVLRIHPKLNQQSAIQFLDYVLARLPFRVEVIQTDTTPSSAPASTGMCWTRAPAMSTSSPAAEWQGRALPPHRRRGVLPDAGGGW